MEEQMDIRGSLAEADKEVIKYRKSKNALVVGGMGVMIFCAWSVIKAVMFIFLQKEEMNQLMSQTYDVNLEDRLYVMGVLIIVLAVIILDFFFHFYVGLAATVEGRRQGKSAKKGFFAKYYPLALLFIMLFTFTSVRAEIALIISGKLDSENSQSLLVEITSFLMEAELLYSVIKVRLYERKNAD